MAKSDVSNIAMIATAKPPAKKPTAKVASKKPAKAVAKKPTLKPAPRAPKKAAPKPVAKAAPKPAAPARKSVAAPKPVAKPKPAPTRPVAKTAPVAKKGGASKLAIWLATNEARKAKYSPKPFASKGSRPAQAQWDRKPPSKGQTVPLAVAPPAKFAYGLPGNFNILGGGELNFDPSGAHAGLIIRYWGAAGEEYINY